MKFLPFLISSSDRVSPGRYFIDQLVVRRQGASKFALFLLSIHRLSDKVRRGSYRTDKLVCPQGVFQFFFSHLFLTRYTTLKFLR